MSEKIKLNIISDTFSIFARWVNSRKTLGHNPEASSARKASKVCIRFGREAQMYLSNVVHACIKFYIVLPETQVSSRLILVSIILSIFFDTARSIILLCK